MVEWQGKDEFVICPVDEVEEHRSAIVCKSDLHSTEYDDLPPYVQESLNRLRFFDKKKSKIFTCDST